MRDVFLTMLAPITWGTTYIVTTEFLPHDRPFLTAAIRVLPVGLLLVLFFRRSLSGAWRWRVSLLGALNIGLAFAGIFVAAYRLPGGVASTANAIQPFLVAFIGWPLLQLVPRRHTLLAATMGLVGVGLLVLSPEARLDGVGILGGLFGVLSSSFGIVLLRKWGRPDLPLLVLTAWQLVAGGVLLSVLATFEAAAQEGLPTFTGTNLLGYLYMAVISTGLAYALWFCGIERLPATTVAIIGLINPVVAFLLGYIFKGQTVSLLQAVGIVLILTGIVVEQVGNYRTLPQLKGETRLKMSNFTPKELEYLQSQWLGRLATVGADGTPHVVPLAYRYNPELDTIDITGYRMTESKKWRDIQRDGKAAFLVDDVTGDDTARGLEIRGTAATIDGEQPMIRITPHRIVGWGLDTGTYQRNSRAVQPAGGK